MPKLLLSPWISQLSIKTTKLDIRKFDLNYIDPDPTIGDWGWAQRPFVGEVERQFNEGLPVRILVLKARQLGISTATEAILFLWNFLFPGSNNLVVSHEKGPSEELFAMFKLYWETWPHKVLFDLMYATRLQMKWKGMNSQTRVSTAKNAEGLRGSTIQAIHASEVAFWPDPATLWTGLSSTLHDNHGTLAVMESTANGVGNWFHDKWLEAEAGDSQFTPMFFPWYLHPSYRVLHTTLLTVDFTPDERTLYKRMTGEQQWVKTAKPLDHETALAALAWRRLEVRKKGSTDNFRQEYPSTPEEAFIFSGQPIFNSQDIQNSYEAQNGLRGRFIRTAGGDIDFQPDDNGSWVVFKRPSPTIDPNLYMIAGDPSRTIYGDPGSIQVINRSTYEQVAVWNGHLLPHEFGHEMMRVGEYFHWGMLCPEVEGGGQGVISVILSSHYPNIWLQKWADRTKTSTSLYGWSTNYQRKRWAIGILQKHLADGSLRLHDPNTVHELLYFTENEEGILGNNGNSKHDDCVMSLAIAVIATYTEGPVIPQSAYHRISPDIYTSELESAGLNPSSLLRR